MTRERTPALQYWAALALIFLLLDVGLLRLFELGADWAPLWIAGKLAWADPAKVYDFDFVTALQAPLLGHVDHRPFIYPPSALLLIAPLALLPFWLSIAILSLGSAFWLVAIARINGADRLLLLLASPVVLCAMAGQPSLLVAALATAAVCLLGSRDRAAGILLGIAVAIKPSLFVLAPIALIAGRHWRALVTSGLTLGSIASASALAFGVTAWQEWFLALPRFQQLIADEPTLISSTITPYATAIRLGFEPFAAIAIGALIAVPIAALAFARSDDPVVKLIALFGGALLVTPYAMNYELALFAPAVLSIPLSSSRRLILPTLWAASLCSGASLLGLAAVYSWAALRVLRPAGSGGDDRLMKPGVHVRA